jgi:hypothetical protein
VAYKGLRGKVWTGSKGVRGKIWGEPGEVTPPVKTGTIYSPYYGWRGWEEKQKEETPPSKKLVKAIKKFIKKQRKVELDDRVFPKFGKLSWEIPRSELPKITPDLWAIPEVTAPRPAVKPPVRTRKEWRLVDVPEVQNVFTGFVEPEPEPEEETVTVELPQAAVLPLLTATYEDELTDKSAADIAYDCAEKLETVLDEEEEELLMRLLEDL